MVVRVVVRAAGLCVAVVPPADFACMALRRAVFFCTVLSCVVLSCTVLPCMGFFCVVFSSTATGANDFSTVSVALG